ncbi:Sensor histidine kinase [Candidatus Rhodobacter oscarellae]|uniref:histidine kinase n=1 Tax=Candidatus Rhodobacter oscarellae TaxID=1675527 RepID=A0A0J9E7C6_9RHOB|nr:ATP-binding protein [Candidatus Rhodobacter lobularis]KMW57689.1 Sensor histidine kinase [Candidatus Rhodobacter lobularis]
MTRHGIKAYLPRTLYGRAALILLLPVVLLQLVVSIVFIQRHYSGVTEQMSRNVALELRYLVEIIESAPRSDIVLDWVHPVAEPLAFEVARMPMPPGEDVITFYDLSGLSMAETLRAELPQVLRFDLSKNRQVWVWLETSHGTLSAMFDRRRVSASNPHQLLVLMVFAGVFLTVIAFVFLRNQLRPIRRLSRAAEAFGKGQTRHYRPSGATEVRAAGQAFLNMRARIERQIEQRNLMFSGISHDLRTPLTRLKLALSMQEESDETRAMLRDVRDMERLVEEFLAFARGDSLGDPESVDAAALMVDIVDKFLMSGGQVEIGAMPDRPVQAMLRRLAVARAVENLIGNALKYGARARVSLQASDTELRICVEDDGPGIPEAQREEALKPFVRLDAARNQDRGGGVGLGLAIAHDIAHRHGGSVELAESETLGGLRAELVLAR